MAASPVFSAIISVLDHATAPLREIAEKVEQVGKRIRTASSNLMKLEAVEEAREHLNVVREGFVKVHESIEGATGALAKFLPVLGALGAGGSLVELVHLTHEVAEARGALVRDAKRMGMEPSQYGVLRKSALFAEIDPNILPRGLTKGLANVSAAQAGKNKNVAALLAHAHIAMFDPTTHKARTLIDMLPELMDAFKKTDDAGVAARAAITLFGKAGADLLPWLEKGSADMKRIAAETKEFGYAWREVDDENIEKLNDAYHKLDLSVAGFKQELGAKLAPVFAPIVEGFAEFIKEHRHEIVDWIVNKLTALQHIMALFSTEHPIASLKAMAAALWESAGQVEHLQTIIGGVLLLLGSPMLTAVASVVTAILGIGKALLALGSFALLNPIGLAITALIALGLVAYEVWQHWDELGPWLGRIWEGIKDVAVAVWTAIKAFFVWIWGGIKDASGEAIEWIVKKLGDWNVLPLIEGAWQPVAAFFRSMWEGVVAVFDAALARIMTVIDAVRHAWDWLKGLGDGAGHSGENYGPAEPQGLPPPGSPYGGGGLGGGYRFAPMPNMTVIPAPSLYQGAPLGGDTPGLLSTSVAGTVDVRIKVEAPPNTTVDAVGTGATSQPRVDLGQTHPDFGHGL